MKFFTTQLKTILATLLVTGLTAVSCSSPQEKHEQRQVDAKESYDQDLKQSQEQLEEDELNVKRRAAKDMIDKSDSIEIDEEAGKIRVDN